MIPPEVQELLREYADVFPDTPPLGSPNARDTDQAIDLELESKPPSHRIYRMSPVEDGELKKQIDIYLAAGQIEAAKSPFGAGVLFAKKKDGTQRLCVDYRAIERNYAER